MTYAKQLRFAMNFEINKQILFQLSSIAGKLPMTIQNCYKLYGFKFSDAISISKTMAGQCLSNKIDEAKSIVHDFRNSITNAVVNLRDVAGQIKQCQILANLYPSIAGLIAKASCLNIVSVKVHVTDARSCPLLINRIV